MVVGVKTFHQKKFDKILYDALYDVYYVHCDHKIFLFFFFNFLNFIFIKNLKTDFKNHILALKINTQSEITCENKKILE